ncbi:hypothetical protein [Pseudomonas sp. TH15]|uniref:hypothetical protein n=1 Tax=Pseudomonas sp. TH15 TaxID=2796381 RepID=UPI001F5B18A0|nr:hypothetical protein [Pseudomonas sp. TH15]
MSTPPAGTTKKRLFSRNDYLAPLPIPTGEKPCDMLNTIWRKNEVFLDIGNYSIGSAVMVLWPMVVVLALMTYITPKPAMILIVGAIIVIAFMGLVGWDWIADRYFNLLRSAGNEFNRKTGMLTISRRFRSAFTAPFYEFDATMEFRPGPYGSSGTAIWLHHRYYDFEIFLGGKIQSLGMSREECMAFWDTLQRYMDVSQPLPELPFLEQFRDLDPATSAHDKLSNRNPNRWRETKSRVWDRTILPGMMQKNLDYPWQNQGCVLMAKIDPTLTIENYYHAQEAKGIHSTPKATDYDDIHRG